MKKGALITIYGINNIGKSTHAKLLCEKLESKGAKVRYMKYPRYDISPTGPFLNEFLRNEEGQKISEDELQMWFVMNRYQAQPEVEKLIGDGYVVVAEDYIGTGIAWGIAKGLSEEWLENANKFLLKENFALMIEGHRDRSAKEDVHVHEQNEELMQKSKQAHAHLADKYGWVRIPLQERKEDTANLIWEKVDDFLQGGYY